MARSWSTQFSSRRCRAALPAKPQRRTTASTPVQVPCSHDRSLAGHSHLSAKRLQRASISSLLLALPLVLFLIGRDAQTTLHTSAFFSDTGWSPLISHICCSWHSLVAFIIDSLRSSACCSSSFFFGILVRSICQLRAGKYRAGPLQQKTVVSIIFFFGCEFHPRFTMAARTPRAAHRGSSTYVLKCATTTILSTAVPGVCCSNAGSTGVFGSTCAST